MPDAAALALGGARRADGARPCSTMRWQKSELFLRREDARSAASIFGGSLVSTKPMRFESRMQCVSTTTAPGARKTSLRMRFASVADTGQGPAALPCCPGPSAVLCQQRLRTGDDVPRLRMEEAAGAYVLFHLPTSASAKDSRVGSAQRAPGLSYSRARPALRGEADGKRAARSLCPSPGCSPQEDIRPPGGDYLGYLFGCSDNITAFESFTAC